MESTYHLDTSIIELGNEILTHTKGGEVIRTLSIKKKDGKNYYFTTEELEPNSAKYLTTERTYKNKIFYNHKLSILTRTKINDKGETYTDSIIDNLNKFKDNLVNKIKYIIKIPEYQNQFKYNCITNTSYGGKLMNIIEYEGNIYDFDVMNTNTILKNCKCKFLIQAIAIVITSDNVYLKLRVSRIIPNDFSNIIDNQTKINIFNAIYSKTIESIENLDKLNSFSVKNKYHSKKDIKDELKSILC